MRKIQKIGVFFIMLFAAAVIAAIYGILHDQISYTFSEEYFTKFKFKQFRIPWANVVPRIGACYVGALATWWMGILIFFVLGPFGFMFSSPKEMAKHLSKSILIVMLVAFVTGIFGLIYGYYNVNETTLNQYTNWVWPGVENPIQFVRVGIMHNASYVGGAIGLVSGILYLLIAKRRNTKQ